MGKDYSEWDDWVNIERWGLNSLQIMVYANLRVARVQKIQQFSRLLCPVFHYLDDELGDSM